MYVSVCVCACVCRVLSSAHRPETGGSGTWNFNLPVDVAAEADTAEDAALVVYRMACSILPTKPEIVSTDLNMAESSFMEKQDAFVARVGDPNSNAALFKDLCLPATDADHLEFNLPLEQVCPFASAHVHRQRLCCLS